MNNEIDNYIDQKIFRLERQKVGIEYTLSMLKRLQSEREEKKMKTIRKPFQYTIYDMISKSAV